MNEISVIVTCYNEGIILEHAIASLKAQTDPDFELLIVNDASTDETTNRICSEAEAQKGARVVWHKKRQGLSGARNSGFMAAKNDICAFLDADDIFPPKAVSAIRQGFRQDSSPDFIFGDYIWRELEKDTERLVDCSLICSNDKFLDPKLLCRNWILHGSSPCKKDIWQKIGGYKEEFSYDCQDVDFWMRAILAGARGFYVGETIYEWNRSCDGMNRNVPYGRWLHAHMVNIAFYDKYGDGVAERKKAIDYYVRVGDFKYTKKMAQELIRMGRISFKVALFALLPTYVVYILYRIRQRKK